MDLAIHLDNLSLDHRPRTHFTSRSKSTQLGKTQLSPTEHSCRRDVGLCYYCGQGKHRAASCPVKFGSTNSQTTHQESSSDKPTRVSTTSFILKSSFQIKTVIMHSGKSHVLTALIHSGSAGNIMDFSTTQHLLIPIRKLPCAVKLSIGNGCI